MTTAVGAPAQHTTHRRLLDEVGTGAGTEARLDAIIVPNGRAEGALAHACAVAAAIRTPVLLLCSHDADAARAVLAAKEAGAEAMALDTDTVHGVVPAFATTGLLAEHGLLRTADTSFKRNLGLLVADLAGWERVLFLDDDITLPRPADLREAAGLLDRYDAVGLTNTGMPDNSVVCHAYREAGGRQDTFVGGGALVVNRGCFGSFFPDIYNEDWFFLLGDSGLRPTARTGSAHQAEYDPYKPGRAASEELGDTLAEGIYGLLDERLDSADATEAYWAGFLGSRRAFIDVTLRRVRHSADLDGDRRARIAAALESALRRNEQLTPELCARYLRDWRADRVTWQAHRAELRNRHAGDGADGAFRTLGLAHLVKRS